MTVTYACRSHYQNICYHLGRGDVLDNSGLFLLLFSRVGLRMPNETIFFYQNLKILGLGKQTGQINSGAFGDIFGQTISTHFGTVSPIYSII